MMSNIAKALTKAPIYIYRYTFKAFVGQNCRHYPTCSQYALEAIDKNGAWRGPASAASVMIAAASAAPANRVRPTTIRPLVPISRLLLKSSP